MAMAGAPQHFFKIILASTLEDDKLLIPAKFVRKFGDELSSDVVTLTVPNGRSWHVRLTKDENKIWFHDGWHDFVKYHSICAGHFLLFKYGKNSNFDVFIFDKTACEIQYPSYSRGPENDQQNSAHRDETKTANSVEITTPKSPSNSPKNEAFYRLRRPSSNIGTNRGRKFDKHQLIALLEGKGIFFSRMLRFPLVNEGNRIFNVVRSLKPQYPSFIIFLRQCHMKSCLMWFPAKFATEYLTRKATCILQASNGREWPVQITWSNFGCRTHSGWTRFQNDMTLKAGDICVFELIRMEDLLLKVSVF